MANGKISLLLSLSLSVFSAARLTGSWHAWCPPRGVRRISLSSVFGYDAAAAATAVVAAAATAARPPVRPPVRPCIVGAFARCGAQGRCDIAAAGLQLSSVHRQQQQGRRLCVPSVRTRSVCREREREGGREGGKEGGREKGGGREGGREGQRAAVCLVYARAIGGARRTYATSANCRAV